MRIGGVIGESVKRGDPLHMADARTLLLNVHMFLDYVSRHPCKTTLQTYSDVVLGLFLRIA